MEKGYNGKTQSFFIFLISKDEKNRFKEKFQVREYDILKMIVY